MQARRAPLEDLGQFAVVQQRELQSGGGKMEPRDLGVQPRQRRRHVRLGYGERSKTLREPHIRNTEHWSNLLARYGAARRECKSHCLLHLGGQTHASGILNQTACSSSPLRNSPALTICARRPPRWRRPLISLVPLTFSR